MCPNCTCEDCRPTPEATARLKAEIASLRAEIAALKTACVPTATVRPDAARPFTWDEAAPYVTRAIAHGAYVSPDRGYWGPG